MRNTVVRLCFHSCSRTLSRAKLDRPSSYYYGRIEHTDRAHRMIYLLLLFVSFTKFLYSMNFMETSLEDL